VSGFFVSLLVLAITHSTVRATKKATHSTAGLPPFFSPLKKRPQRGLKNRFAAARVLDSGERWAFLIEDWQGLLLHKFQPPLAQFICQTSFICRLQYAWNIRLEYTWSQCPMYLNRSPNNVFCHLVNHAATCTTRRSIFSPLHKGGSLFLHGKGLVW